jgi:hypothetical protein
MEAFEGSKHTLKSWREKAKVVGKKALKHAKKFAGVHVGPTTEANPSYYIVVTSQGAMVRKDIGLESPAVHGLSRGDLVTCVELSGRRARIVEPVEGWVSIRTQNHEPILMKTIAPDMSVQVAQMGRRFEKLKSQQPVVGESDIAVPAPGQAIALPMIPTKESDISTLEAIRGLLVFKDDIDSTREPTPIPKLALPSKKGYSNITRPSSAKPANALVVDLLSIDEPVGLAPDTALMHAAGVESSVLSNTSNAFPPVLDVSGAENGTSPVTHIHIQSPRDPFAELFCINPPKSCSLIENSNSSKEQSSQISLEQGIANVAINRTDIWDIY